MELIKLNAPDKERGSSLMSTLSVRASERIFADKELSIQDLSDLLWAANGLNRPDTGHRTAPSALNSQDVDIYVTLPHGTYLYNPVEMQLEPVTEGDLRIWVADQQEFMVSAPVFLIFVSDISRFPYGNDEVRIRMGAYDVGIVSQNVNLFCASVGFATVPRASMDIEKLRELLRLKPTQYPMMNNPVGYRP
ncbi:SagB/ThcOx family dehydrogenase [Parabacteroides pacaensis]|uniref:SagB/ThcOx family dehydrogenase n=1 Tax=Parabacteroides pacaensis TaxID=2086575 RepID=UPI000D1102C1|nr:SagB/ThcOx family dehydrogenase [Parabacteroides pacaensis]